MVALQTCRQPAPRTGVARRSGIEISVVRPSNEASPAGARRTVPGGKVNEKPSFGTRRPGTVAGSPFSFINSTETPLRRSIATTVDCPPQALVGTEVVTTRTGLPSREGTTVPGPVPHTLPPTFRKAPLDSSIADAGQSRSQSNAPNKFDSSIPNTSPDRTFDLMLVAEPVPTSTTRMSQVADEQSRTTSRVSSEVSQRSRLQEEPGSDAVAGASTRSPLPAISRVAGPPRAETFQIPRSCRSVGSTSER